MLLRDNLVMLDKTVLYSIVVSKFEFEFEFRDLKHWRSIKRVHI